MVSTRRINKLADPQTEKEIDNIYNLLSRTGFYFDVLNNRVGIGTIYPGYSLDVRGGDIKVTRGTTSPAMASLAFGSDFNKNYIYGGDQDNNMIFYVNGGERMRITSGGLVGIGTTSPNQKLEVNGNQILNGWVNYGEDAGSTDDYACTITGITAYTTGMMVTVKCKTANTTGSTLNINSLGAKTIVKRVNTATASNDILANSYHVFVYDGTNFVIINPVVP